MKFQALFVLVFFVLLASCEKEKPSPSQPAEIKELTDFALVPVKDAEWKIHAQGKVNSQNKVDTSYHVYATITAMNKDTFVKGKRYFKYYMYKESIRSTNPMAVEVEPAYLFVREDTAARTVFLATPEFLENAVVYFREQESGTVVNTNPKMEIKYVDSMIMEQQYLKRWVACNSYDKNLEYFYKAYGMCTQTGIALRNMVVPYGGQVIETEFRYKNSRQKFVNSVVF